MQRPEEALYGTLAISAYCAMNKIEIIRVHDVLETGTWWK